MPLHIEAAGSCSELTVPRRSLGSVKPELVIPVDSARVAEATVAERSLSPAAAGSIATMALTGALDSFAETGGLLGQLHISGGSIVTAEATAPAATVNMFDKSEAAVGQVLAGAIVLQSR